MEVKTPFFSLMLDLTGRALYVIECQTSDKVQISIEKRSYTMLTFRALVGFVRANDEWPTLET